MNRLTTIGVLATLLACWLPGGLIHRGAKQVNRSAEPPATTLLQTIRSTTAAKVKL